MTRSNWQEAGRPLGSHVVLSQGRPARDDKSHEIPSDPKNIPRITKRERDREGREDHTKRPKRERGRERERMTGGEGKREDEGGMERKRCRGYMRDDGVID